jgi:hypothetical protein
MSTDAAQERDAGRFPLLRRGLKIVVPIAAIALAGFLLHRTLSGHSYAELAGLLRQAKPGHVAAALGFAFCSYGCLTLFDLLALHYAQKPLAYRRVALASFVSLSLGHNIGLAALSSGAIRYHFYSRWGLGAGDVAKVILFCGATVGIGLGTLAGLALILKGELAAKLTGLPPGSILALGCGLLLAMAGYLALCAFVRGELEIRSWRVRLPPLRLAALQFVVGPLNFLFVAACLHQALSAIADAAYLDVAASYVLANIASLIAHVPGGLGVIEAVVATTMPGAGVVAGLILFRLAYFLVPLLLGSTLFAVSALIGRQKAG